VTDAITRGQLLPAYQPIVALPDGRVIGVEGLIRPQAPSPFANPLQLFAAAEASGQVTRLDLACIDAIVAGAQRLPADLFLTVNLTPATLVASEFSSGALLAILARYGFAADRLVVEITERQPLADVEVARGRIEACRRAGVRFAADDIGAGNAGLRLLSDVAFDVLKVDLSLVQRSEGGPSGAVVASVVDLAARTGALVVAEGVEHSAQLGALLRLGITAGQGFYLGRPGPLEQALAPVPTVAAAPMAESLAGVAAWRQSIGLPIS
jgi:EAL domain-containing protein (putative c-di-GMP-specific phosphodiesterase class I)